MASRQCEICKEAQSKYKCPTCRVPYCSLVCFKKHKEIPCKQFVPTVEEPSVVVRSERSLQVDDSSCVLSRGSLQSLVESSEIRGFVENTDLQKLIRNIDSSNSPEIELDIVMEDQMFYQFTDKILSIVSPQEQAP